MTGYILLGLTVLVGIAFNLISRLISKKTVSFKGKKRNAKTLLLQGLSILLFFLYLPHLFSNEVISHKVGLQDWFFAPNQIIWLMILKWLIYLTTAVSIMTPFFGKKEPVYYSIFITPIAVILNAVFFEQIVMTITGETIITKQIIIYALNMLVIGVISIDRIIDFICEKDFSKIYIKILKGYGYFLTYLFAFMPVYFLQVLFGEREMVTKSFSVIHRIYVYAAFIIPALAYICLKNKTKEEKRHFLIMLSLSGFMQYFVYHTHRSGLGSWPLHLCNTAIVIMLFVYVFNIESAFYFTYFVNVPGAFFAIILPNTESAFTTAGTTVFWFNHWYAFFLPILGVALGIFKKPSFNMIKKAIPAFAVYVVIAATLNAWLNNSPINVNKQEIDYFFLYGNFLIGKLKFAYPIKENFIWQFQLGDTMMKYFYLYTIIVFVVFVGFMFVTWGIYQVFFNMADKHKKLAEHKSVYVEEMRQLIEELNGRPLSAPLHEEGKDMIIIKNFSKRYNGSDRYAVKDLNLEIHGGEVFGFIGHNGAGKSTTIKSLVGIQSITEGSIEIEGYDIARQPLEAKLNIGFVSDNHAVYEQLTGREYVEYIADLYKVSKEDKEKRLVEYATMFGIIDALDREIKSYSHGMKQKINVISSLIHNPKVWVLDEPFTGLDPTSTYQIKECMREHAKKGNIVFFSSHVIEVVEKMCDRIAIINAGELKIVDTVENIKKYNNSVEELYIKYSKQNKKNLEPKTI